MNTNAQDNAQTKDQIIHFQAGEHIIKKGEQATQAYMILSGAVRVYMRNNDKIVDLAQLKTGEIFGETAIFNGGEYGANVDAIEDCALKIITLDSLRIMMDQCDPVLASLIHMLSRRLGETNKKFLESETREFMDIAFV